MREFLFDNELENHGTGKAIQIRGKQILLNNIVMKSSHTSLGLVLLTYTAHSGCIVIEYGLHVGDG